MIRRIKPGEAAFRHGSKGREPIAPPSDQHVHYTPSKRSGIGCITSRESKITFFELLAYELGCNVTTAKRLYEEGLIR